MEIALIVIPRDTIRVCRGVECPCLLGDRPLRNLLEIEGIDNGREGRFLIQLQLGSCGRRRLLPFVGNGTLVDFALELARIEVRGEEIWSVDSII